MTAQILATPPGTTTTLESGAAFPVEAGVIYQIAVVDAEGNVGPILDPQSLEREADGNDLVVTLPDGTVIVLEGMVQILAQGAGGGLAGPDGDLVIATLEQAFAPAAGPQGAPGNQEEGGSSQAFNQAQITDPRQFGEAPEGPFGGLGVPGFILAPFNDNLPLLLQQQLAEETTPGGGPEAQKDIVITADDGRIIILARGLLANDVGTGLKIVSVDNYTGPGVITLRPDGNVEISLVAANAVANNSGVTQTFTYTVEDADGKTSTTEVLVYVDEDGILDGFITGPGDLGNGESEIYIANHPKSESEPPGTMNFSGGDGDDFFQVRDEQNISIQGGRGFDTIVTDIEYSSGYFDIDLPSLFSKTNNGIEAIVASDEISGLGIVRIRPHGSNSAENWDFSRIQLTDIDEIVGRGGNDTIIGSVGDDTIFGDAGTDLATTFGPDGNDFIDGWLGNDVIDVGGGTGIGIQNVVRISAIDHGIDTINSFDNNGSQYDQITLDDLFDKLEADIGLGAGGLSTADRTTRVVLVDNGPGTDIFIDQSAAGDGSDLVQIADVTNVQTAFWDVGGTGAEDIFVGA